MQKDGGGVKLTSESLMKIYGTLPGGVHGKGAMSVPQLVEAFGADMKIHLAERDPQHHSWASHGTQTQNLRLRILLSYWYYKDLNLDELFAKYFTKPYPDVFADSGGFSAFTQGASISLDEYAAWIQKWKHLFSTYANLDVIGDAKKTWANQKALENVHGLKPLPVFHVNEDWKWLDKYLKKYLYIALGGMVPYLKYKKKLMPWLIIAFKKAQSTKACYHGFGVTSWEVLKALPWYSVDSSSWGAGFRYGRMAIFDESAGKFVQVRIGDRDSCYKVKKLLAGYRFDWKDFADRSKYDRAKVCGVSALSYMLAEQWLRKRHGEIHLHLADANPKRFGEVVKGVGVHLHLADTSNGVNYGDAEKGVKTFLADTTLSLSKQAGILPL